MDATKAEPEVESANAGAGALDFRFRSFPCKSDASLAFAERLHSLRNFKSTLSLVGEPGMHYRAICEDIAGFYDTKSDYFLYFDSSSFTQEAVISGLQKAITAGTDRVTCVIIGPETFSAEQKKMAVDLLKGGCAFESFSMDIRTIFCVTGDLDVLFDEEVIDENLYILMGTAEVRVPSLKACANDIPIMAQKLAVDSFRELGKDSVPRIDQGAKEYLRKQPWPENHRGLRQLIRKAMELTPGDIITLDAILAAGSGESPVSERELFMKDLTRIGDELVEAAWHLAGRDPQKTAAVFGSSISAIENRLK